MDREEVRSTSRQAEEKYLERTLQVIEKNLESYSRQVEIMKADIDEMLEHYHDNDAEVYTILSNTITMHDHMKRALERNRKAKDKPYFGRIVFHDQALDKEESLYIGKGGVEEDSTHQMVVDWRAPVANAYYENGLGECSYTAPGDKQIKIDLKLKRTYEIEHGMLSDYFDSEVVANDELLTKYLAKNKQAVLGEIVATIQKEQNEIIRKSPYHNIIVQGVAGSGKTTVAMHRISFILYNYQERFRPADFYIVGSNRILLNYITGVLPDLDVHGVRQMTMEELFVRLLYEDWDDKKYRIRRGAQGGNRGSVKGTLGWFNALKEYCDAFEWNGIMRDSIYLNPRQFVEGLKGGKNGVYDERETGRELPSWKRGGLVLLADREAVERYIRQNPKVSMQSKINMLNDRLMGKIQEEFLGKGIKYTEAERKAILKEYRGRYGRREWKGSVYTVYREFLQEQIKAGSEVDIPDEEFDVYDLAALAYLYKRIKETEVIDEAHHIVIDEAQDFGMMAYSVLHFCIRNCTYTVMGDVSQNIHFGFGLNDWEELKSLLLPDPMDSFGILKKSYRNTVEISQFATRILQHGHFSIYPVEPIIRHGEQVQVLPCAVEESMIRKAAECCRTWQKKGFETIAVICRSQAQADWAAKELGNYVEVLESDLERAVFGNGIMVLPVEYTKGLEFDTVLILDPSREDYPTDDGHAKLLYVAATRALHELCVLHGENLTGLIADPLPERNASAEGSLPKPGASAEGSLPKPGISAEGSLPKPGASAGLLEKRSDRKTPPGSSPSEDTKYPGGMGECANQQRKSEHRPQIGSLGTSIASQGKNTLGQNGALRKRSPVQLNPAQNHRPRVQIAGSTKKSGGAYQAGSLQKLYSSVSPISEQPQTEILQKPASGILSAFGDMPSTESLRPLGHSRIDLKIQWVTKRPDGLYLQSRYGTLRLSPIGSAIVRVTFAKGGQPKATVPTGIAVSRTEKYWMYKDTGRVVELSTEELVLLTDKLTGAIQYMARGERAADRKLLLAERSTDCRQLESMGNRLRTWLYLNWEKGERLYGFGPEKEAGISLRGTARYLSQSTSADAKNAVPKDGDTVGRLPFLLSDRGYGILPATGFPVFCCDLPSYGSYVYAEYESQMDFYLVAGKRQDTMLRAYSYLCGEL